MRTLTRTLDDLAEDLRIRGYALVRADPEAEDMTETASALGLYLGAHWMGSRILEADGDSAWLPPPHRTT